ARLHRLTARGHPIRDLARLDDAELDQLIEQSLSAGYGAVEALPGRMLDAVADYRVDEFDRDLSVAIATLPVADPGRARGDAAAARGGRALGRRAPGGGAGAAGEQSA